jgi:hypothetical protein
MTLFIFKNDNIACGELIRNHVVVGLSYFLNGFQSYC